MTDTTMAGGSYDPSYMYDDTTTAGGAGMNDTMPGGY